MTSTDVYILDSLLKTMPITGLERAKDKLEESSRSKAVEIANLVEKDEDFGLITLLQERALLKEYISRIDIQMNILTVRDQKNNEVITVR